MYKAILVTSVVVLFLSCTEDILVPDLSGNLVGYVLTYDEFGRPVEEKEDVTITAIGPGVFTTRTNAKGRFELKGLSAGTYELMAEKEGFGTEKKISIKHLGGKPTIIGLDVDGSTFDAFHLCHIPLTTVESMVFENDSLTGTFNFPEEPPYPYQQVLIALSDQEDFATTSSLKYIARYFYGATGTYKCALNNTLFGFTPGNTIHFKVRICSNRGLVFESNHIDAFEDNTYFNYETLSYFYPALGAESGWFSYVVPE
jgi:hypothetical protein